MRERTPSADDTPKRAPPAPPGEADVAVRKATEVGSAAAILGASKMVASTHSPDDLGVSPIASASQHHQHHHHHHHQQHPQFGSHAKSAQDKRSRLSNVINNLLKKVPAAPEASTTTSKEATSAAAEDKCGSTSASGGDLGTLEKYVMTVLSSVIEEKSEEQQQPPPSKHTQQLDDGSEAKLDHAAALPPSDDLLDCSPKSLGDIILERLSEQQQPKQEIKQQQEEADSVRAACEELLNELLSAVQREAESTQSLHCSLPLDKVASVLQASQESSSSKPQATTTTTTTTTAVRHLCLYCERKFASVSLRQRHTERVHQASPGGRRSERNGAAQARKPSQQSCQYCVDKCSDDLEGLFRHLVASHSDKYHGCLQCATRFLSLDALDSHAREAHAQPAPAAARFPAKDEPQQQQDSFDSNFYSNVSCNIRENLLHHIDGKLRADAPESSKTPQYQLPIDISLSALTPVYAAAAASSSLADRAPDSSSELAGKPGKSSSRAHPRRVSFEKYNFPRKYHAKEQWSCAIKDLSRFDISTQLALRKKQRLLKDSGQQLLPVTTLLDEDDRRLGKPSTTAEDSVESRLASEQPTVFSSEFKSFLRLKKLNDDRLDGNDKEIVYAELTGEWARPRIYVCGACADRYTTLKELEDHKSAAHPNVWCMHFEFSGDQRELYKHLVFLPGVRCSSPSPSMKTRSQQPSERICTKCSKSCASLAELHRHMLECGGDQAWLLGFFGNGKKKCKWRPFGSRSRRRRQRGMKRNIQNSQTPRNNLPRERPTHTGPRVRPSDRESIQKMLANLPAKRATRKVLQENARSQGRLRNLQSRGRAMDNPASRKLLKNAKSFHRKKNLREEKQHGMEAEEDTMPAEPVTRRGKLLRSVRVLSKKKNIRAKESVVKHVEQPKRTIKLRSTIVADATSDDEHTLQVAKKKISSEHVTGKKLKKRMLNPLVSMNASLKAKSQLRTNDGKFARNVDKKLASEPIVSLDAKSVKISKRPVNDPARLFTRSTLRAAAKSAWKEHTKLSRRITRLRSSDGDEAESDSANKEDTAEKTNEIMTVVTKHKIGRTSSRRSLDGDAATMDKAATEQVLAPAVGRGRRPKKEVAEAKANSENLTNKLVESPVEPKTRSQRLSSNGESQPKIEPKPRRSVTFKDEKDMLAETPKKNSKIAVEATSPDVHVAEEKIDKRRNSKGKESTTKKALKESVEKKTPKRAQKDVADKKASSIQEKAVDLEAQNNEPSPSKKEKVLRKSQRNKEVNTGEVIEEIDSKTETKSQETAETKSNEDADKKESVGETVKKSEKSDADVESKQEIVEPSTKKKTPGKRRGRVKRVQVSVSNTEEIKPSEEVSTIVEKVETIEATAVETPKESSEIETMNLTHSEIKTDDNDLSHIINEEKTDSNNAQNLSLEALQQESSNSNMDSGKENSSEAIANLSKLKVVRPKKSRGRKDKTVATKRSLNSVIGILTEGVNVPVEPQDSTVVLTAQATIEPVVNSNPQITYQSSDHQSTIENTIFSTTESKVVEECENISDKIADVADVSANAAVPVSATLQPENKELTTSVFEETNLIKKQDVISASDESQKDTTPVLVKIDSEVAKEVAPVVEPPANDIILDLSRRKPKGKGSFLEKIVSKIAKQKDVSLDGDNCCHLDISHNSLNIQKNLENKQTHTKECYSTKIVEEIKPESVLNRETSVNLKETTVNIVNNKANDTAIVEENTKTSVDTSLTKVDSVSNSIIENTEEISVKAATVSNSKDINESESKLVDKESEMMNGVFEKIDSKVSIHLDNKLPVTTEKEKTENSKQKPKQKQKSKKRSLDSNSPTKNKKKLVDDDKVENEEEEEEICLAGIMKLLDRSRSSELSSESTEKSAEIVKPGKRKTPDDEVELDSFSTGLNTIPSLNSNKEEESFKKSKRKSGQKNKKIEHPELFNEINNDKEYQNQNPCKDSQIEKTIEKNIDEKNHESKIVIENCNSSISELTNNLPEEQNFKKLNVNDLNQVQLSSSQENSESEVGEEKNENNVIEQTEVHNAAFENIINVSKSSKSKKKATKKNSNVVNELKSNDMLQLTTDESFKVPESSEIAKPGKKRTSKRRSKVEVPINEEESEKDENIINEQLPEEKANLNDIYDRTTSIIESEEKLETVQVSKRTTRNSKNVAFDETLEKSVNIRESDDSDVSLVNDIEPTRRRRSQRKNIAADSSRDVSVSSVDENVPSVESKTERKRVTNRKVKKNVVIIDEPVVIGIETPTNNETVSEPENIVNEKLSVEPIKETQIELKEATIAEELSVKEVTSENVNTIEEAPVLEIKEPEKQEKSDNILKLNESLEPQKVCSIISSTPEPKQPFVDETFEVTNNQESTLPSEISSFELDESTNLEMQAPKKRVAGNFAIVTKSGKILIVEKKKKLTKEIAKFFCEVCSTSFTRKSSLKKHNSSQSHILQMTMHGDKIKEIGKDLKDNEQISLPEFFTEPTDKILESKNENDNEQEKENEKEMVVTNENEITTAVENKVVETLDLKEKEPFVEKIMPEEPIIESNVAKFIEPVSNALYIPEPRFTHKSPEEELEDEMLDEEICKITENMSHDEYVLTDHVSPLTPEPSLTPVKEIIPPVKNVKSCLKIPALVIKAPPKRNKKEKKKINLADEHLSLDTPVPTKVAEPPTVDVSEEKKFDLSITDNLILNDTENSKIDEPAKENEEIFINKKEIKSKKNSEKKITTDSKRTGRNRNQNSKQEEEINFLETSRPKRNQLRPSYKEDDFDLIESPNEGTEERQETLKAKRDKTKISAVETEQSDFEGDVLLTKSKEISEKQVENNLNINHTIDSEKDVPNKKQRGKKNQTRKVDKESDKADDLEISLIEKDALESELNDNEDINLIKSKVESNEVKDVAVEHTESIRVEQVEVPKKKRGRKPKNAKIGTTNSVVEQNVSTTSNKDLIDELETNKQVNTSVVFNDVIDTNQKQSKSKKNQNKRKQKNVLDKSKTTELKDISGAELTEKSILTDKTEISIQSLPVDEALNEKSSDETIKQSLLSKSVENLKMFETVKNDVKSAMLSDFDSDENSLDTNISVDIQKLLDDPEMTTEIAKETDEDSQSTITNVDVMNVKKPVTPTIRPDVKEESNKTAKKSIKSTEDKITKKRGRKPKCNAVKTTNDASSLSDASEVEEEKTEDKPQRSKSKIVKSVFGRVFGGEKVKEVLDDWQSRSDSSNDSADEEVEKTSRRSRSSKSLRNVKKSAEANGRSRQSKKRAEELISRAFNDDSPLAGESRAAKNLRLSRKNQAKSTSPSKDKIEDVENEENGDVSDEEDQNVADKSKKTRKRNSAKDLDTSLDFKQTKYQNNEDNEREIVDNTEDSQVSQTTLDKAQSSEVDNTEVEELNGRLSPTYSSDDDDDTLRSSSDEEENQKPKKKRTNELVTIVPTDAAEDNAQDLELPANKPKVLNFDEELFVECCSRLKATSEKEFRNAKKIKLDHSVDHQIGYSHHHKKDDQLGYRKDRWRDVESQNSLGSLLESVNQLLGEEYNSQEKDYSINASKRSRHHGHHHHHHHHHHYHHNRRHDSPERSLLHRAADADNMGYDDSLDVAFEHNNKLRDKIQQRMRESEDLIATSFSQKNSSDIDARYSSYAYDTEIRKHHSKSKANNGIDGLLDKTLSNLLQSDEKHDHPSTPMKLLAELACARAPSVTTPTKPEKLVKSSPNHKENNASTVDNNQYDSKAVAKKTKNPIKELFERKNELNEKKQQLTKLKISSPRSSDKPKKQKKAKNTQHNLPVIRTSQYRGGLTERKKRRDSGFFGKKKEQSSLDKVKDVYDFDDEESASDSGLAPVLSYRTKADVPKEINMSALLSKTIGDTLTNGKSVSAIGENLENMLDRKFKDIQNYEPATKSPTRIADEDEKSQQNVIGPMDDFVERRQKSKRSSGEHSTGKHSGKSKKKAGKSLKKKSRNAWYENDSSDEFVTKLKADDIGVGISKSQRTCSKGKQNLFAEISSTSSESEFEEDDVHYKKKRPASDKQFTLDKETNESVEKETKEKEDWPVKESSGKRRSPIVDHDHKKSESELSDHPLVIDENLKESGDTEHQTNSDGEIEERTFELDDLYREDSSIVDSDRDESSVATEERSHSFLKPIDTSSQDKQSSTEKYISIEDALELLDRPEEETLSTSAKKGRSSVASKQSISEVFQKAKKQQIDDSQDDEEENLPEKLSSNEKPQRQSENLPLHVFLSRKVQESKKRKQQQELKKLMEEQERIMLDLQPTRRQRKCAIGKQGLLAEISSSDEELSVPYSKKSSERIENHEKPRSKQKQRESKEKRKERYLEKKHEQMIAKEQKAIEEEIMRELEEKKLSAASEASSSEKDEKKQTLADEFSNTKGKVTPFKNNKVNSKKLKNQEIPDENDSKSTPKRPKSTGKIVTTDTENDELNNSTEIVFAKKKRPATRSPKKTKKIQKTNELKTPNETKKIKQTPGSSQKRSKSRPTSVNQSKEIKDQPRSQSGKRESDLDDDEELKATKSWKKVDEGVGVAIGRRKRAAANQLYYWSSSSDDEEVTIPPVLPVMPLNPEVTPVEGPEDDRLQQHGWIVGDSHKKMITMLAMEKQLKEKRRRSENDEQSPGANGSAGGGKGKSKKHRNSTS